MPIFERDEENYDKWEIQWKAFAQVENIVSALGKVDANMPASDLEYEKTEKAVTTDKEKKAAVKATHKAMAYLAMALKPMELLRLLTKTITHKWPEGEAWKVMTADLWGFVVYVRRKDIGHLTVPQRNRKEIARVSKQTSKGSMESLTNVEKQDIGKQTAGNCSQRNHPTIRVTMNMQMWTTAGVMRLSMSYALLNQKCRKTVKWM